MSVKVVAHPETGAIITVSSKNPEYGTIRVDSVNTSMENGFLNKSHRTAFIRGKIVDLTSMSFKVGTTLPGKIVRKESFEPFYEDQTPKQYPAGHPQAGENCLTAGLPTYVEFTYTGNSEAPDIWVGKTPEAIAAEAQTVLAEQEA